jgi:hypothetical protein
MIRAKVWTIVSASVPELTKAIAHSVQKERGYFEGFSICAVSPRPGNLFWSFGVRIFCGSDHDGAAA